MKRNFPIFALAALSLVLLISCGSPTPPPPAFSSEIWITHSVIKNIAENKALRNDTAKKMGPGILELVEQYKENGASFKIPTFVLGKEDLVQLSLARKDGYQRVFVYIYRDSTITSEKTLLNDLAALGLLIIDSLNNPDANIVRQMDINPNVPFIQARIKMKFSPSTGTTMIERIAGLESVSQITLVTEPFRSAPSGATAFAPQPPDTFPMPHVSNGGAGIVVGVMSDDCGSNDAVPNLPSFLQQAKNQNAINVNDFPIPNGDNLAEHRTHEGLAMMEVVHSVAPWASVTFASAAGPGEAGIVTFTNNIDRLASSCQVITDDILYPEEPMFEDGDIAKAMERNSRDHQTVFVSAAGNWSKNVYSFRFKPTSTSMPVGRAFSWLTQKIHNNSNGDYRKNFEILPGRGVDVVLQWDERWGHSANDYDLYLVDIATSSIVAASASNQTGGQNPFEHLWYNYSPCWGEKGFKIVISAYSVDTNYKPKMKLLIRGITSSAEMAMSIVGHQASDSVLACSAMNYDADLTTEVGSSQGPFVGSDVTRKKPDVSGLDGAPTTVFAPFTGTSAAAPYVAGIAALMLSTQKTAGVVFKSADVRDFIRKACISGSGGFSTISGNGRSDVFRTVSGWLDYVDHHFASGNKYTARFADGVATIDIPSAGGSGNNMLVGVNINNYTPGEVITLRKNGADIAQLIDASGTFDGNSLRLIFDNNAPPPAAGTRKKRGYYKPFAGALPPVGAFPGTWSVAASGSAKIQNWGILLTP